MKKRDREARLKRLRELIEVLRTHAAHEGHMNYVIDALELTVDLLADPESEGN